MTLSHDTVVDLLDGLDLFASLSDEEVDSLARRVDTVSWEPGTLVFAEGDAGDSCYVIHSGQVKLTRRLADGQPIALARSIRPRRSGSRAKTSWRSCVAMPTRP